MSDASKKLRHTQEMTADIRGSTPAAMLAADTLRQYANDLENADDDLLYLGPRDDDLWLNAKVVREGLRAAADLLEKQEKVVRAADDLAQGVLFNEDAIPFVRRLNDALAALDQQDAPQEER